MSYLEQILHYNERFVANRLYKPYETSKYPDKKMVILTCMDSRLIELLPKALNLRNGDAKIVKAAGALLTGPYDGALKSILIAISLLKAEEVYVIGHHDCGMIGLQGANVLKSLRKKGIDTDKELEHAKNWERWLTGCNSVEEGVKRSVKIIRDHPLFPRHIPVHGLVIDPKTGKLDLLIKGSRS